MDFDPLKNLRYDSMPNEDIMSDKERYMATRDLDYNNFEPDSAYFAQFQQIIENKNQQLKSNKGSLDMLDPKAEVYLTNHYNPRVYKELSALRAQAPESKTRAGTRAAQKLLKASGHYDGEIDGWYGNKTKAAIKAYEYEYINQDAAFRLRNWFNNNIKSPLDNMFSGDDE